MIGYRLAAVLIAAATLAASPATVTAQEAPPGPEGTEWRLTSYAADAGVVPVPFGVAASLLLEAGQASGSGGCNTFDGIYQLDGASLTFNDEIASTLKQCADDIQAVEDAYLAAVREVTGWVIVEDGLRLSDAFGDTLLTFERPLIGLTESELSGLLATLQGLQSQVDTLQQDMTRLNVGRLRDRIKVLERDTGTLKDQLAALEKSARTTAPKPPVGTFSAAETILLEAIPTRIAVRCQPLRSQLPKGAKAGVACSPDSAAVASVDYYLLEGPDAAAAFQDTMETFNVPEATSEDETCATGVKSQRIFIGQGWQSEGCYRTGGKAELRFVDNATDCKQVKVGNKRLKSPALYIALQGADRNVARVHAWATRSVAAGSGQITSITQPIARPDERLSPSCPT